MDTNNSLQSSVVNEIHWENGLTYSEYRLLIDTHLKINQTTGINHSENMIEYTKLNVLRMNKWDKIIKIVDALKLLVEKIETLQKWLVLTEAWCGDAAQNLPIIQKIADLNENIEVRYLLRDENLDIMDAYLTNGARSIPKLIIMDKEFHELGQWGPRPLPAQELLLDAKSKNIPHDEYITTIHSWYGKDRGKTLQLELINLIANLRTAVTN